MNKEHNPNCLIAIAHEMNEILHPIYCTCPPPQEESCTACKVDDSGGLTPPGIHDKDCKKYIPPQEKEGWVKQFDEEFFMIKFGNGSPKGDGKFAYLAMKEGKSLDDVKSFISKVISNEREKMREKVKELIGAWAAGHYPKDVTSGALIALKDLVHSLSQKEKK